jgi:hypothetical protein
LTRPRSVNDQRGWYADSETGAGAALEYAEELRRALCGTEAHVQTRG